MAHSPYKLLAVYYDRMFESLRCPMGRARREILGDILKRAEAACDLACGTGTTAVELARRGIRMYGVDASPQMCRLARKADLDRVARAVAKALRPGGWFYFDVNNRAAFENVWAGTWRHELPGVVMVMHGGYDRRRQKGWSNAEWFIRKGNCWRRTIERVEEVAWTAKEIRTSLQRAGFSTIRSWDQAPFVHEWKLAPGFRTIYLARKTGVRKPEA